MSSNSLAILALSFSNLKEKIDGLVRSFKICYVAMTK
jgi:hypothetical protein